MSESVDPAPKSSQKLEPGAAIGFVNAAGKVIAATIRVVEDPGANIVAITGPNHLSVVGVPFDAEGKQPESWHFKK